MLFYLEFLVEVATTVCGPSVMQYSLCVQEEVVTCYHISDKFDVFILKAHVNAFCR